VLFYKKPAAFRKNIAASTALMKSFAVSSRCQQVISDSRMFFSHPAKSASASNILEFAYATFLSTVKFEIGFSCEQSMILILTHLCAGH
jgi:hypothetical protein